jgi:TATA-binding protein-associated factor Taf7
MLKTDSSNNPFLPGHENDDKKEEKKDEKKDDKKDGDSEEEEVLDTNREITYTTRWVNLYGCNPDYSNKHADK